MFERSSNGVDAILCNFQMQELAEACGDVVSKRFAKLKAEVSVELYGCVEGWAAAGLEA